MSFLPYSGGGTGGWIGAFTVSGLAHVGLVAGLIGLQSSILELAELQSQEASFDVAVALDQLDTALLSGVTEGEEAPEAEPETLEEVDAGEELTPEELEELEAAENEVETLEEAEPETLEEIEAETAETEAETETLEEAEAAEDAETLEDIDAETLDETEAEVAEAEQEAETLEGTEVDAAEAAEAAALEEALATLEAETLETAAVETATAAPETEALDAGPVESAEAVVASEASEAVVASPLSTSPLASEEPGGLSPIAPDAGGVQTVTTIAPVAGGIDGGIDSGISAVEPISPVGGGSQGISVAPVVGGLDSDAFETVAPEPEIETIETVTSVAPEPEIDTIETVTSVAPESDVATQEADAVTGNSATTSTPAVTQRAPTVQEVALSDLIRRVRITDADPCLAALPQRDGLNGVGLALLSDSRDSIEAFSTAFVTPEDQGLTQTRSVLDARQCAAVSYIRNNVDYPATRLGLRLDADLVDSGGVVSGILRGSPGQFHKILLIDDNGVVQDLERFTVRSGDFFRFEVPVTREGEARDTRQILMALSFAEQPVALNDRMGQLAQDVFSGLPGSLADGAEMAVATFDVR